MRQAAEAVAAFARRQSMPRLCAVSHERQLGPERDDAFPARVPPALAVPVALRVPVVAPARGGGRRSMHSGGGCRLARRVCERMVAAGPPS